LLPKASYSFLSFLYTFLISCIEELGLINGESLGFSSPVPVANAFIPNAYVVSPNAEQYGYLDWFFSILFTTILLENSVAALIGVDANI
jgi:hypothetical protein